MKILTSLLFVGCFYLSLGFGQEIGKPLSDRMGTFLERPDGKGSVNLRVINSKFRLYFLDKRGNLMNPDYPYASLLGQNSSRLKHQVRFWFELEGTNPWLTSPMTVRPPLNYWFNLNFYLDKNSETSAGKEPVVFNKFNFRQTPALEEEAAP
jgi:hypothetical protein